ncbi:hypothetical protein AA93_02825 [Xylella fastidiosa subsp. pauca 11399]|nr:hypothetical protein AA93_02825 [Xylella fastidiosa subsp. pauca 11399]
MGAAEKLPELYTEEEAARDASQAGYTPFVSVPEFTGTATKSLRNTFNNAGTSRTNWEILAQPAHRFQKLVPHLV